MEAGEEHGSGLFVGVVDISVAATNLSSPAWRVGKTTRLSKSACRQSTEAKKTRATHV